MAFVVVFGFALIFSLVLVGIPAAILKTVAAMFCVDDRGSVIRRSIFWAAVVGAAMIAIQMAANYSAVRTPDWLAAIETLGGWRWTGLGFAVLAVMALTVDYWKVVRPLRPRLSVVRVAGFLLFSNTWVFEAALLLVAFNQETLFPKCFDPVKRQVVDTFSEPRPAGCQNISAD